MKATMNRPARKSPRQQLADTRLSSGITIRQLFSMWGLPLDSRGMLLPPRTAK
jgi:hypothetical protein